MPRIVIAVLSAVACFAVSTSFSGAQSNIRYVVSVPKGSGAEGYVLWSSYLAASQCGHAMLRNLNVREWCEDGTVPGVRPKLGRLKAGTVVEKLDSTECHDMVQVRVLSGELKDQVGCAAASALTSARPGP